MDKSNAKVGTWAVDARCMAVERVIVPVLAPRVWQYGGGLICAWSPADGPATAGVLGQVLPAWLLADAHLELFLTITTGPNGWQSSTVAAKSELLEAAGFGAQYGIYPVRSFAPEEPIGVLAGRHVGMFRMGSAKYEATVSRLLQGKDHSHLVISAAPTSRGILLIDGSMAQPGGMQLCNDSNGIKHARTGARRGYSYEGDDLTLYATRKLRPLGTQTTREEGALREIFWSYGKAFWDAERRRCLATPCPPSRKRSHTHV